MKITLPVILQLLLLVTGLAAIEFTAQDNNTLSLQTDIVFKAFFDLNDFYWAFQPPEVKLELEGASDKKMGFDLILALEEIYSANYEKIIDTCYFWTLLSPEIKLQLGQFKAPFGQEIFLGKFKRPYFFHSLGSSKIAPGLDRGGSVALNNVWNLVDLDFGVFNGAGIGATPVDFNSILCTARGTVKFKPGETLELRAGYSLLYKLEDEEIVLHTIGQGISGKIEWKIDADNKLSLFSEYLEKHAISGAVNEQGGWEFAWFNALSLRSGTLEAFATFEIYKPNSMFNMDGDEWKAACGLSTYPFPDLRLSLAYEVVNRWNMDDFAHKILFITLYQF